MKWKNKECKHRFKELPVSLAFMKAVAIQGNYSVCMVRCDKCKQMIEMAL